MIVPTAVKTGLLAAAGALLLGSGIDGGVIARQGTPLTVTAQSRALQPGELVVLTIGNVPEHAPVRVRAFDRDATAFRVTGDPAGTWRALIGVDLDATLGVHDVIVECGAPPALARVSHRLVIRAHAFPTRALTVDQAFVNPPAAATARIERDARTLASLWPASSTTRLWDGAFIRPVPQPSNSAFGSRSVYNGQPRSPHGGADFASPAGTPIVAPGRGRVVLAEDLYYTGETVVIDHGLGLFSLFAHLSEIKVVSGSMVDTGTSLGRVGATGRVTGPHLHWAVRVDGARVDPLSLLALLGTS